MSLIAPNENNCLHGRFQKYIMTIGISIGAYAVPDLGGQKGRVRWTVTINVQIVSGTL